MCSCGSLNSIATGKSHRNGSRGMPIYDVNTKAAAGMLHSGMGATHVSNWLASVNIPAMSTNAIKRREREIGPVIETVAQQSCDESLKQEIFQAEIESSDGPVELTASYDMGWQRRSSGRTYNSKSGHGCLIGNKSGNIIAYGSRKSTCRMCEVANTKHCIVRKHDCRYNWHGSAKSMEASVGVDLLKKTTKGDIRVKCVVMDDDASTLSHIRKEFDPDIKKWSDINHAKKSLTNQLYSLAKRHNKLSSKVISYLKKCYAYALTQNKGSVQGVEQGLRTIVPHVFGSHDRCGSWCGYVKQGAIYRYKSLPYGKCLTGEILKQDLMQVFETHALNAERLAPLGSTKANESFNNMVASKAPKSRHYSASESLDYRIGAAVSQKNLGPGYLLDVYRRKNMSPGKALTLSATKLKQKAIKRKFKASTKAFKQRRVVLAESRNRFSEHQELREGTSYQTNIALDDNNIDVTKIPEPVILSKCVPFKSDNSSKIVIFDLETCSSEWNTEICQISACVDKETIFNRYILPDKPICSFATNVTGLTMHEQTLLYHGKPVHTVPVQKALEDFISWLRLQGTVVLVGHNIKAFDSVHLLRIISDCGTLEDLSGVVRGFVDTLPHFRKQYPHFPCHKEEYLVEKLLNKKFEAHNALNDCIALYELIHSVNSEDIFAHSFGLEWAVEHVKFLKTKHQNINSFSGLIRNKVLSKHMAEKCASSGLDARHLKLAFSRKGGEGLRSLFSEMKNGRIRVTKRELVLEKVISFFESEQ